MTKKATISLGEALDIAHVGKLKPRLTNCLAKNLPVQIAADKIEKVDSAGLQLMCCFIREVENKGNPVTWTKTSDSIFTIAELLGLTNSLKLK
ncbi:STAS domain-containing protein [Aliikangiella marina]|uniref:STAS domain-containing protein n=1 Tax=Aliikangiella marina TaxID=1712262 RepID=A0A545TDP3_9GAMM|nr:STAS domain-containing protein [Aliikangiella marina]TQV75335.1 STAS domain-containing protein [Aliikangiella marina]